ncbi:MAG: PQQ-dependent sugar dehydrogenase, partial [Planctomycetota bacterium]
LASFFTGLRGVAFHPEYATNGFSYLWYDAPSTSGAVVDMVLARITRSATDPDRADPTTLVELLREPQTERGHGSSDIEFGADGFLYAVLGDGGLPGDPTCNAQDPTSLMGTMIRVDVDSAFPYAIPASNPFVGDPLVRDEIWHAGLRHPWKWSFDRETGDAWIADVGQDRVEEIDFAPAGVGGLNFGWKVMEGSLCYSTAGCAGGLPGCGDAAYTAPLFEYDHGVGCSVTGGYVYRGHDIPSLRGQYLFADWCAGRFWSISTDGPPIAVERTHQFDPPGPMTMTSPVSFGEDGYGELYVIDGADWELYRIERTSDYVEFCVGPANGTGRPGRLRAFGLPSVAGPGPTIAATETPANRFGLFVVGPETGSFATPGGLLCVGGGPIGIERLPLTVSNGAGIATLAVDPTSAPFDQGPTALQPGSTWTFQYWHRDTTSAGFAFTSALSIRFTP